MFRQVILMLLQENIFEMMIDNLPIEVNVIVYWILALGLWHPCYFNDSLCIFMDSHVWD